MAEEFTIDGTKMCNMMLYTLNKEHTELMEKNEPTSKKINSFFELFELYGDICTEGDAELIQVEKTKRFGDMFL